jgi:ATP:ADP antiporter, AAA family
MSAMLQAPLELAETLSNEDAHYLEKRGRTKWWSKAAFPKVAMKSIDQVHKNPPPLKLWQKVLALGAIFFAASFNLTILQNLKDAIMVTTAGAETLPWLSSLVVLPASLGFFMLYGRMLEVLPQRTVFYASVAPLIGFYIFFAAVLYPMHGVLHPHGLYESLSTVVPTGLHGLLKVIEYWTFSLFYCSAELWGSVVISVLFWGLANEVCTVEEARAVYPMMGIAANVALVLSGSFVKMVCKATAGVGTHAMLSALVMCVACMAGAMGLAKAVVDRWVIAPYCVVDAPTGAALGAKSSPQKKMIKKKKPKGSLGESFAVLKSSPKITNLAILVMSYGISHRLFEFAWKGQLRALFPTPAAYQGVLADVSIATGWATITLMLLGKIVFQKFGWNAAAMATPLAMGVTGACFFFMSLAANQGISIAGMDPTAMAFAGVAAGALTQVMARASKFSLFDSSKEMVWIEMTKEEKSRGKAAVDLLGSQIGKSGGAWVTQALLIVLGSIQSALPVISAVFVVVCASWLRAVANLGGILKEYEEAKIREQQEVSSSNKNSSSEGDVQAVNGRHFNSNGSNGGGSSSNGSMEGTSVQGSTIAPQAA